MLSKWGWGRGHWALLGSVMSVAVIGEAKPVAAQVTYNIFPAKAPDVSMTAGQPTRLSTGSRVTLAVRDSTIKSVVNTIAQQANLQVLFDDADPTFARRITIRLTNVRMADAFTAVLKGTGLVAKITSDGETVVIRTLSVGGTINRTHGVGMVAGKVTDSASGAGLGGAAVRVEGTKISTVSSDSGNFTLRDVPAGDQVVTVRLFGYKPVDRSVTVVDSQRTVVRMVMVSVPTVLSGVVTTATGLQQRVRVGNDITLLNADSIMKVAPVSNLTDMLETRVPGLVIQHTSGIPGAPSRLRLRGISSINSSNDPILIVDGIRVYADQSGSQNAHSGAISAGGGSTVASGTNLNGATTYAGPSALDQIDPNSIETIEVLKGPSATAIYGSDAGSGVIVITTKHGRVGPTRWNLALDQGRTTLPGYWPANYYSFFHNALSGLNSGPLRSYTNGPGNILDSIVGFQALNDPRYSPLTGHPGQNRDASLTFSGGVNTLTWSVIGSASSQSGYLHLPLIEQQRFQTYHGTPVPGWMKTPDQYTTYGGSSSLTAQLGTKGTTVSLTNTLFRSAQQQSSLQSDLSSLSSMYVDTTQLAQLAAQPLFSDYYTRARLNTTTFNDAVSLQNWAPWSWLPLAATLGLNVQDLSNNTLLPHGYISCVNNVYDGNCATDSLGNYSSAQGTNTTASFNGSTTLFAHGWVSTAVGINVYTLSQSNISFTAQGIPAGVETPNDFFGGSNTTGNSSTYGWYVQPTLNLHNRFFASPGFRLDGGSNSGTHGGVSNGALSLFPKLDLSFIAVNRPPSDPVLGLTLVRPRIAFGISGVQPAPGQQLRLLAPRLSDDTVAADQGGLGLTTLGNTQLHPERDQELEGGIDLTFGNQRVTLSVTGYNKLAKDALLSIPIAPSVSVYGGGGSGLAQLDQTVNIGNIRNRGVELTFGARLVDSRLLTWSVNGNVSKNSNLLLSLASGVPQIDLTNNNSIPSSLLRPGYPVFGYWARPILGFADVNGDGVIGKGEVRVADSSVFIGAQQPNYEMTLNTSFAFFNDRVQVNTAVNYQNGLTQTLPIFSLEQQFLNPAFTHAQQAGFVTGTSSCDYLNNCSLIGLLQSVNTFRWQSLSVSYLIPPNVARRLFRVPALSVALQGSNLGLFSKYRGADPNVNANATGNLTSDNGSTLPQPRVWSLRVTLGS